jgi:myo-inositol-1(or 4)-monophosphatase
LPAPDNEEDAALLVAHVREAGAIARKFFGGPYKSWSKGRAGPVTEADLAIDDFLKKNLLAARPLYGWLSEETKDDRSRLGRARGFIVDPIDGTYGFLKGRPQFTVVAAVVTQSRPVAAAIYNPMTDEMYEAALAAGATKNGVPIHVAARADITGARLLTERSVIDGPGWATPWPADLHVETRASAAYRMALVAEGAFDAMISLRPKCDWDIAAGDLIVAEAGGRVTAPDGGTLSYNGENVTHPGAICAGPLLHAEILARLRSRRGAMVKRR